MEKYDRESNTRIYHGIPRSIVRYLLVAFALYAVALTYINWEIRIERASFVGCIVFLIFIVFPARKNGAKKPNYIPWYDAILGILGAVAYFYFVFNCREIINQGIKIGSTEIVLGIIGVLVTLEACRRATGLPIVIVASLFILYALTAKSINLNVYNIFYTGDGILGTPIRCCVTFIVMFVIFGSFLEKTGISQFFIDMANSLAGASSGGPAKVAVISSALCGMVSGSSVGNTVTTGSVTIPLMKKNGYKSEFAAAVEAASSTGGQIMPPIMGAAAFIMVEYTNMPYSSIALRAILPAALYFTGIFIMVHMEAKKMGLIGISRDMLPRFLPLMLRSGYLLLPLLILIYLLVNKTMATAAIVATISAIIVSMFKKDTRITPKKFFDALESGAKSTLTVGIACAVAGIIANVITTTGIGTRLITLIVGASGGHLFIVLILTMLTCIVLGMGVPTTANYVIMATTCAPILIKMQVPPIAAHMFVFYFGIVADITPPVALAAYAGSDIAHSKPMKTALNATKLAIAAFIVPYIIAFNPAMVLVDTTASEVVLLIATSFIGMFGISMGLQGYCKGLLPAPLRIAALAGGLLLIKPGFISDIVGIAIIVLIILFQTIRNRKAVDVSKEAV
ncbi:MAG: TRAP transporter permease [Oscillospiraceae bacterium]|nr:TRAP transporter permease [Oscillospiraceae bacterium]